MIEGVERRLRGSLNAILGRNTKTGRTSARL